jgi:hypothetical protein
VNRQRVGFATAAAAASALGIWAATSSGTVVKLSVRPVFTVSGPAGLDLGTLRVKESGSGAVTVSVRSSSTAGYRLAVSRTALSVNESPVTLTIPAAPAGTTLDMARGSAVAVPTSGSLAVGRRSAGITPAAGDAWTGRLAVGPIDTGKPGERSARVTFTATATGRPAISTTVVVRLAVDNAKGKK